MRWLKSLLNVVRAPVEWPDAWPQTPEYAAKLEATHIQVILSFGKSRSEVLQRIDGRHATCQWQLDTLVPLLDERHREPAVARIRAMMAENRRIRETV